MSHIVEIRTQVRDPVAVRAACQRLHLPEPVHGTFKLYTTQATGLSVQLPGWRYPAVCDLASGQVRYDNFQGHWGEQAQLDRFVQAYTVEKAKLEARRVGHSVAEQAQADGSIRVTIHQGA